VSGAPSTEDLGAPGVDGHGGELDRVLEVLLVELPLKQAAELAARLIPSVRDNEAYKRALKLKRGDTATD
jgi:16S rRNA (cytidine1402-2'-O)-methyltransferase